MTACADTANRGHEHSTQRSHPHQPASQQGQQVVPAGGPAGPRSDVKQPAGRPLLCCPCSAPLVPAAPLSCPHPLHRSPLPLPLPPAGSLPYLYRMHCPPLVWCPSCGRRAVCLAAAAQLCQSGSRGGSHWASQTAERHQSSEAVGVNRAIPPHKHPHPNHSNHFHTARQHTYLSHKPICTTRQTLTPTQRQRQKFFWLFDGLPVVQEKAHAKKPENMAEFGLCKTCILAGGSMIFQGQPRPGTWPQALLGWDLACLSFVLLGCTSWTELDSRD